MLLCFEAVSTTHLTLADMQAVLDPNKTWSQGGGASLDAVSLTDAEPEPEPGALYKGTCRQSGVGAGMHRPAASEAIGGIWPGRQYSLVQGMARRQRSQSNRSV